MRIMGILVVVLLISVCGARQVSEAQQVKNLTAFARLYGYVKHFYPSDEVQDIDWDKFLIYGTQRVREAKSNKSGEAPLS
jgi:hypothetical protein